MSDNKTLQKIKKYLMRIETLDEYNQVCSMMNTVHKIWKVMASRNFDTGNKVRMRETALARSKKGYRLEGKVGTITKAGRTKATVDFEGQSWRVPYTMLQIVR